LLVDYTLRNEIHRWHVAGGYQQQQLHNMKSVIKIFAKLHRENVGRLKETGTTARGVASMNHVFDQKLAGLGFQPNVKRKLSIGRHNFGNFLRNTRYSDYPWKHR
jgi:hypothetical protein